LDAPVYTPTQKRILAILADGNMHLKEELYCCIDDELANKDGTLRFHMSKLRLKLRPQGLDVICQYHYKRYYYRQVRLISSAAAG
jgi:DNA-binding transcriptional ArsR family regulator